MKYKLQRKKILKDSSDFQTSEFRLQRGVAVYLALIIMFAILVIGLGISTILIGQLKITRGMENSVVAIYAADTGIENILYQEKLCRKTGCAVPPDCKQCCQGLPDTHSIPLTYVDNGAKYKVGLSTETDAEGNKMKFTSTGEYKGVKRAIETSILAATSPLPEYTIWQFTENITSGRICSQPWNYSMGYEFTPLANGRVTKLCGYFGPGPGPITKWVKLYNSALTVMASVQVTTDGASWSCTPIPDPPGSQEVVVGLTYYVVAEIAGNKGCYDSIDGETTFLPADSNGIRIVQSIGDQPLGQFSLPFSTKSKAYMRGMADIVFSYCP
jgi:hypothetical protein